MELRNISRFFALSFLLLLLFSSLLILGSFAQFDLIDNTTLTPSAWVYMPYIARYPTPTFTLTPSLTPTSTDTPRPTSTPTSTPTNTPMPEDVQLLDNHSYYERDYGGLVVVGEILNNTSDNLWLIKVSVKFYNEQEQIIDTEYTYTDLDLAPGEKTCFDITLYSEPDGWSYYEFDPISYWDGASPFPSVSAININNFLDSDGDYRILGEIRNDHNTTVEYAKAQGTLYDASGTVLDCHTSYANANTLEPGQISSFELDFYRRADGYSSVHDFRLAVQASEPFQ